MDTDSADSPSGSRDLGNLRDRRDLRADCGNCFGLCCVVPAFAASADFAIDKPAGHACPNLQPDFRCGIHERLRPSGFTGCTVFDCFGAGQKVSQVTFDGRSWRGDPRTAAEMFEVFPIVRQLQELLWYLTEALAREALARERAVPLRAGLGAAVEQVERLTLSSPQTLPLVDVARLRGEISPLLRQASELIRADARPGRKADHAGADLIGARLKGADLRGAVLRGAYLIGADLRSADLRLADLIGADLRGADLRGADLTGSIFLTQFQLNAAIGDRRTTFPDSLLQPAHWGRS